MSTDIEHFSPDYIIPPGEILEETLEARGIKKKDFADRCGRTAKMISEIIAGKAAITPETALQFERVLGVSAQLWSNLESRYRLRLAEQEEEERLQKHAKLSEKFPISDLIKFGFLKKTPHGANLLSQLLQFFGVGGIEAMDDWLKTQKSHYRHSKAFQSEKYALAAWLRCGHLRAENIVTKPYNQDTFKACLVTIRALTRNHIEDALPKTIELCADSGVAVVLTPELKGTRVSGATRWLSKDKALIQLSVRHKSDDHFWFTFFHEAGHIILHGKKELFIDEDAQSDDLTEKEADVFAQNLLVQKDDWQDFVKKWASYPENIIREFADEQGIAPGVVVGRLQFQDKLLSPNKQNGLKVRYEWDSSWTTIHTKKV
jgi:HTH-type transcriptional regulator / antitoxin HigA